MALSSLPLVLLVILTSLIIWQLTQVQPLATGRRLAMHNALQNIPTDEIDKRLAELLPKDMFAGKDPFFRSSEPQSADPVQTDNVKTTAELQEIHLSTIAQGTSGRYCLINDTIYKEGHNGEGFTVVQIEPGHVVLSTPVQTFSLQPGQKITLEKGKILNQADEG